MLGLAAGYLARHEVDHPRGAAEWLAAHLLGCPRAALSRQEERELDAGTLEDLREGLRRLRRGEPLQYVLGEWDFRGHRLRLDRRVLIPRPETEQLVQRVLDASELWGTTTPRIADVGTGSGCIAVSLALERPCGHIAAIDTDAGALALAAENAQALGVADRIDFHHGELGAVIERPSLDAVVSNPPYIGTAAMAGLPRTVRDFEPRAALDGGSDGLQAIRRIVRDAAMTLKPRGLIFLEIGETQAEAMATILENAGFDAIRLERDLARRPRFVSARMV